MSVDDDELEAGTYFRAVFFVGLGKESGWLLIRLGAGQPGRPSFCALASEQNARPAAHAHVATNEVLIVHPFSLVPWANPLRQATL